MASSQGEFGWNMLGWPPEPLTSSKIYRQNIVKA
jgi:hypothetical protein